MHVYNDIGIEYFIHLRHFYTPLQKAKYILEDHQYPATFYEPVIHEILDVILLTLFIGF